MCGELDLRGEVCPFTFVRARLHLESLALGSSLRILVDHEPAVRNIPRSAAAWGQEITEIATIEPGLWAIVLVKRVE